MFYTFDDYNHPLPEVFGIQKCYLPNRDVLYIKQMDPKFAGSVTLERNDP